MSINVPVVSGGKLVRLSSVTAASSVTSLDIAVGSANEKNSWTEIIASTAEDYSGFYILCETHVRNTIVDIGIGSASNEVVLIPDLFATGIKSRGHAQYFTFFPIRIPEGSRVSVRYQRETDSNAHAFQFFASTNSPYGLGGFSKAEAIGVITSGDSNGTTIDPGGAANTKGSWVELKAATDNDLCAFMVSIGNNQNATLPEADWLVDVGMGSAGNEEVIVADLWIRTVSFGADAMTPNQTPWFFTDIPSGTRIAIRAQSTTTDATDRLLYMAISGLVR